MCALCGQPNLRVKSPYCSKYCYDQVWKKNNPDKVKLHNASVYATHRELYLETQRKRHKADPLKYRLRVYSWKNRNPEKVKEQSSRKFHKRRALLKNAYVEPVSRSVVYGIYKGLCGICLQEVDKNYFSLDHIIPLAKGGLHKLDNIQLAHPICNSRKGVKLLEEIPWQF